jgi:Flp pilus assembly pilin Flp
MKQGQVVPLDHNSASHELLMTKIIAGVKKFFAGTEGASIGEYAVALMLIAIVAIATVTALGSTISAFFVSAAGTI